MKNIKNRIINKFIIIENKYKLVLNEYTNKKYRDDLLFDYLTLDDLKQIKEIHNNEINDIKYEILKDRINDDKVKLFKITDKNNIILGYCSLSYRDIKENTINYCISMEDEGAYLFDDYVFNRYRGKGIHGFSIYKRVEYAIKDKKKYAVALVYSWNKNSSNNFKKIGFKEYGKCYYFKLIGKLLIR
ncbi:GNAT family N-acetyltransferase [Clostridium septicum]|uniref:GNAT family N-acetyltransferase n=1 Tax=Clostridium septicum TaxID=1504 RepID=UPI00083206D4|nr:GNAT family N-acetyltransferase [Clostridium septicum]WLF68993.1 GNAT family N-acetyltransferase [Clostridium septicum]